jgi:hypothetical protein
MHRHRFDMLLGASVLLLLSAPVVRILLSPLHPFLARVTVVACFAVMLLSAVVAVSESRRAVMTALALSVPLVLISGLNLWLRRQGIVIAYHLLGFRFWAIR